MNMLCGHAVPFSETWPTSVSMRTGRLYPRQTPGPLIAGNDSSSSPGLLPTPRPQAKGGGSSPEEELGGLRPSGTKRALNLVTVTSHLLRTPTAQLAVNGGSQHPDKRKAGGHGPTLADEVEHLLPTPNATDSQGGARAVPESRTSRGKDHGPRLRDVAPALLPTPSVALATGGQTSRSGDRIGEPLLPAIAKSLTGGGTPSHADSDGFPWSPERDSEPQERRPGHEQRRVDPLRCVLDWGIYTPAIQQWEAITGRSAPRPTEPGRTSERLSPRFVEWMMGLPEGWVTDVPGLTRNAQLKALGNGVVPQQAAAALRLLLPAVMERAA